jgi:hypothetical protein
MVGWLAILGVFEIDGRGQAMDENSPCRLRLK